MLLHIHSRNEVLWGKRFWDGDTAGSNIPGRFLWSMFFKRIFFCTWMCWRGVHCENCCTDRCQLSSPVKTCPYWSGLGSTGRGPQVIGKTHREKGKPFKGEHLSSPLFIFFFVYWFVFNIGSCCVPRLIWTQPFGCRCVLPTLANQCLVRVQCQQASQDSYQVSLGRFYRKIYMVRKSQGAG